MLVQVMKMPEYLRKRFGGFLIQLLPAILYLSLYIFNKILVSCVKASPENKTKDNKNSVGGTVLDWSQQFTLRPHKLLLASTV